jgi:putative iron-only hydrogenase system regulator
VEGKILTPGEGIDGSIPPLPVSGEGDFVLEKRFYILTIVVEDRERAYRHVNELLHNFSEDILLRVGYPVKEENMAIIFLVLKTDNDTMGALSGKLGQIPGVRVKTVPLKR